MRADRLLKLAKFLMKVKKQNFNYAKILLINCKTQACAIGYCPTIFPKHWKVCEYPYKVEGTIKSFYVHLRTESENINWTDVVNDAMKFFDITHDEAVALFASFSTDYKMLKELPESATPKQVANNIIKFVELKKARKI